MLFDVLSRRQTVKRINGNTKGAKHRLTVNMSDVKIETQKVNKGQFISLTLVCVWLSEMDAFTSDLTPDTHKAPDTFIHLCHSGSSRLRDWHLYI